MTTTKNLILKGVYCMNLKQSKHDIATIGTIGKQLDPRKILGIAVAGNTLYLQTLDIPARITEKLNLTISAMELPAGASVTTIKSLQVKNRLTVVEVDGPMTSTVKNVIDVIAGQLNQNKMVTAFFPGGTAKNGSQYYFGFDMDTLRPANPHVRNIRLLDDGQGLVFTQATQMKQLALSAINDDWVRGSKIIYESKKEISFLGRVQDGKIAITMSDETSFLATLTRTRATVTNLSVFRQKVTSVLGTLQQAGVAIFAGTKGRELILAPVAVNE